MADQKEKFDIEFAPAPEKGKACHMQIDHDLHSFILNESTARGVTFRKMANRLLCDAIQEYIRVKKMAKTIRNRTS
jgi:hypothetical protein